MPSNLALETWTWYGISMSVVAARLLSRRLLLGSIKNLQVDDALMALAACTYTVLTVTLNIVADSTSNLIDPDAHVEFTPQEIKDRTYGSKITLVVEQNMILTIWTIKTCLLIMYGRLTTSLKQHLVVKIAASYVAFAFVFMEIFYFAVWCRPFHEYWAVPTNNPQCSAATKHLITNAVFNISSDLMIISIPMPIVFKAQLPLKKKLILGAIFGLGSFTILSAILNKYYSFTQPFGSLWTFWYDREASTAILIANIPFTWTLLQRAFNLPSFAGSAGNSRRGRSQKTYGQFSGPGLSITTASRLGASTRKNNAVVDVERDSSQEAINIRSDNIPLEIWQNVQFTIQTSRMSDVDRKGRPNVSERKAFDDSNSSESELGVTGRRLNCQVTTSIGRS